MIDKDTNFYKYLSTQRKDYTKKPIRLATQQIQRQEFEDPVGEGFRNYLLLDQEKIPPPMEDGTKYTEKFRERYKDISKVYFKEPLNAHIILKRQVIDGMVTDYQRNFCDIEKDIEFYLERKKKKISLPEDMEVPQTTYTRLFRDPIKQCPSSKEPPLIVIQGGDLGAIEAKVNKKLNIQIGISQYEDTIGRVGQLVVETNAESRLRKSSK